MRKAGQNMGRKVGAGGYLMLAALVFAPAAPAVEVYRWVDAEGVVHFSQWKPESGDGDVQTVALDEGATQGVGGDIYPVAEMSAEIDALRAEMAEAREQRAASRPQAPPVVLYQEPVYPELWPVYRPGGGNRPQRPERPRPTPLPQPSPPASFQPPDGWN